MRISDWSSDVCSSDLARSAAALHDHEVIVLDIALPDGSGLDLLRDWRGSGMTTPILLLTERGLVDASIGGPDAGADDYLFKPFDLMDQAARISELQRHTTGDRKSVDAGQSVIEREDLRRHSIYIKKNKNITTIQN